jgi:RNA polymerase sigma-70 factor (ECF subfamily)
MVARITEDSARTLRRLWFDYLDDLEPLRPRLHALCLKLTGSVWEAEDLVQDTLLRGFGIIGRADMSPGRDPDGLARRWFSKPQAYLCRIAIGLWIDRVGRPQEKWREEFAQTDAPRRERAAIALQLVFDFATGEIAELLSTTPGDVNSALGKPRAKSGETRMAAPHFNTPASPELIDRFISAFVAGDVEGVRALLFESCTWEVQGVGGERGKRTIWLNVAFREGIEGSQHVIDGERIAVFTGQRDGTTYLGGLLRFEETDNKISRIINYGYCSDTLAYVAARLAMTPASIGYHQRGEILDRMITNAQLPWDSVQG